MGKCICRCHKYNIEIINNLFSLKLAILSPAFPSAINGLGDYSNMLGLEIKRQLPATEIYYLGLPQIEQVNLVNYFTIKTNDNSLCKSISENLIDVLFINYSNYGYQKKGIPVWLIKQVALLQKKGIKIITFFHEVYASGKVWQSVFWLHQLQKKLFRSLYHLSDAAFCSNQRVLTIIQSETEDKGEKAKNIGLFSNITEPDILIPWVERKRVAVVFGSYGRRKLVYDKILAINSFCKQNNIDSIIDIGCGEFNTQWQQIQVPVTPKGLLSNTEIATILRNVQFGFIDYATSLLGKSGIFAAYAAYGIVPINFSEDREQAMDGLIVSKYFFKPNGSITIFNCDAIYKWYQSHNINNHTKTIISRFI